MHNKEKYRAEKAVITSKSHESSTEQAQNLHYQDLYVTGDIKKGCIMKERTLP